MLEVVRGFSISQEVLGPAVFFFNTESMLNVFRKMEIKRETVVGNKIMDVQIPTPEQLKLDVQHLKEWLSKEPHLPQISDDDWLITFLHHNKYSLEKTKTKIENYYSYRNKYPHLLKNRDPTSPAIRRAGVAFNVSISDRLTKNGERLMFIKANPDPSLFDIEDHLRRLFMILDTLYLEKDRNSHFMTITDMESLHYLHFLKGFCGVKIGVDVFFNAYSERLKALHVINCSVQMEKVFHMFKAVFPQKIAERFFLHSSVQTLREMVDEQVLCSDFGGKGPSLAFYDEYTTNTMEKYRDWFLEQTDVCANDELRRKDTNCVEEMKGSFRMLECD